MYGQSRSNSCACSSGAVAELCNYPASDSTVPSLGVLLPCAELGREEKEWKRPGGRKDHFQQRSSIFRASAGAICQCNADLPPDTPKGERDLPHSFSRGQREVSRRLPPRHPQRLPVGERTDGKRAGRGDSERYELSPKLRGRFLVAKCGHPLLPQRVFPPAFRGIPKNDQTRFEATFEELHRRFSWRQSYPARRAEFYPDTAAKFPA